MRKQLCSLLFLDPLELYMYVNAVNEESRPEQDNTSGTDSSL